MLNNKERNLLFPEQRVNFISSGSGAPFLQKADFTPSSYFSDINILEDPSMKRKFMNLDTKNCPGVSSVFGENSQYYRDNFAVGRREGLENFNKLLFSNVKQANFQQEASFFHGIFKDGISNLQDTEHTRCTGPPEQSERHSEYSCGHLNSLLQCDMVNSQLPVVLESSSYAEACLEKEKLKNNVYASKEPKSIILGKQDTPIVVQKTQPFTGRNLSVNASLNSEIFTEIGDRFSAYGDDQDNTKNNKVSPIGSEKIWDGSLKLNASTTVPAVAFFKSGEKAQSINWPEHVEIKGKVRLHAFEKFIQELPRSRNRALMVISLCWKAGSSNSSLAGMMEIAKGYKESKKVGFAQIPPGIDIYVCPRSDLIITILAKYGFFKGMAAVEEDQDSFIGCVVWRRNQTSANSECRTTEGKKILSQDKQPLDSTRLSVEGVNSPAMEAHESEAKAVRPTKTELKPSLNVPDSKAGTAISPSSGTGSMITENKTTLSSSNNNSHSGNSSAQLVASSAPYSFPLVSAQQKASDWPSLNLFQQSMKPEDSTIPLSESSGADEAVLASDSRTQGSFYSGSASGPRPLIPIDSSNFHFQAQLAPKIPPFNLDLLRRFNQSNKNTPKAAAGGMLQDELHIRHQFQETCNGSNDDEKEEYDDDDLPEFDFNSACGGLEKPMSRFPLNDRLSIGNDYQIQTSFKQPSPLPFPEEAHSAEACQSIRRPNCLVEEKFNHGFERKNLWDDDDDDMPEWCPPDLELSEQSPLLGKRPMSPLDTAPQLLRSRRSHDFLQQRFQPGLLGPCPTPDSPAGRRMQRFSKPQGPPSGSRHRRDSSHHRSGKFSRRPPPAAGRRRHRR